MAEKDDKSELSKAISNFCELTKMAKQAGVYSKPEADEVKSETVSPANAELRNRMFGLAYAVSQSDRSCRLEDLYVNIALAAYKMGKSDGLSSVGAAAKEAAKECWLIEPNINRTTWMGAAEAIILKAIEKAKP